MVAARRASRRRYVLIIVVLTALTLITLDTRHGRTGVIGTLGRGAHTVVSPVERAVDSIASPISDWWHGLTQGAHLRSENRRLKEQIAQLQGKQHDAEIAISDDAELKRMLGLLNILTVKSVTGTVIGRDQGNFSPTLEIDRGSSSGIAKGMTAIAPDGLVGQVIDVGSQTATIRVLTDPLFNVGVQTLSRRGALPATAAASGQVASNELEATFQSPDVVRVGDLVRTAPSSVTFPPGIPVGRISTLVQPPDTNALNTTITPFVDIDALQHVTVLLWVYGQNPNVYSTTTTTTTTTTTPTVPGATTTTLPGSITTTTTPSGTTGPGH